MATSPCGWNTSRAPLESERPECTSSAALSGTPPRWVSPARSSGARAGMPHRAPSLRRERRGAIARMSAPRGHGGRVRTVSRRESGLRCCDRVYENSARHWHSRCSVSMQVAWSKHHVFLGNCILYCRSRRSGLRVYRVGSQCRRDREDRPCRRVDSGRRQPGCRPSSTSSLTRREGSRPCLDASRKV